MLEFFAVQNILYLPEWFGEHLNGKEINMIDLGKVSEETKGGGGIREDKFPPDDLA